MPPEEAAEALAALAPWIAADILEQTSAAKAADVLEEMGPEAAGMVMEEMGTGDVAEVIPEMSEGALTEILLELSVDKLYDIPPAVLFDALPSVPVEHLVAEVPPEPAEDLATPVVVYVTRTEERYLAIRPRAGEWVVLAGTPIPVTKLMIKTREDLRYMSTTITELAEKPAEIAAELPEGQVVYAYLDIAVGEATPEDTIAGHITFEVEREWLAQNQVHLWSITFHRYDPELGEWVPLPTKRLGEDDSFVYYSAATAGFSVFAISGSQALPRLQFKASDLIISPGVARPGEPVTISAAIANISDRAGTYVATLWIDRTVEEVKSLSVASGETAPVSFTMVEDAIGRYEMRIDRLMGSLEVAELEPAEFVVSHLVVAPVKVEPREEVSISAEVSNIGGSEGIYKVTLKINGVEEAAEEGTLAPDASQVVRFKVAREKKGDYTVEVDGSYAVFTVKPRPTPVWVWAAIGLGSFVIIAIAIWWLRRRPGLKAFFLRLAREG